PGLLILALIGLFVFVGSYVVPGLPTPTHRAFAFLEGPPGAVPAEPGGDLPDQTGPAKGGSGTGQQPTRPSDLRSWATPISTKLDIPVPAMQAYGDAELATAPTQPGCQLRWTTLAGIGKIESNHGRPNP